MPPRKKTKLVDPEKLSVVANLPDSDLGTKFKQIADMPLPIQDLINKALVEQRPLTDLAKELHSKGFLTNMTVGSARQYLHRYKWAVVEKQMLLTDKDVKKRTAMVAKRFSDLDAVGELAELVDIQKARVNKLLEREKTMPMLFGTLGNEIRTLSSIIGQYAELAMETGVIARAPRKAAIAVGVGTVENLNRPELRPPTYMAGEQLKVDDVLGEFFKAIGSTDDIDDSVIEGEIEE